MAAGSVQRNIANRALTVGILGALAGCVTKHDETRWAAKGKAAFLANQSTRFDKNMAGQHSLVGLILSGFILALTTWVAFEVLSFVDDLCLRWKDS